MSKSLMLEALGLTTIIAIFTILVIISSMNLIATTSNFTMVGF